MIWIFLLIAALAVVGIVVANSQERSNQQEQTQQQPKSGDQTANPNVDKSKQSQGNHWAEYKQAIKEYWNGFLSFSDKWREAITALGTAFVAAFTGLLFVATILLWWGGERHSERELRAYVSVVSGSIQVVNINNAPPGPGFRVTIELKNSGQTPGYDFTTWIKPPEILDKDAMPFGPATPIEERSGRSIIGPGGSAHITWTLRATPQEILDVLAETKKIFVWGGADYRDIFYNRRFFIFRDTNAAFTQGINPGAVVALQPHSAGYEAN